MARPRRRTASRCAQETERCTHVFEISGYSLHKAGVRAGDSIESATFAVGGHDWRIVYYPHGDPGEYDGQFQDYVSVFLELVTETTESGMAALFDFRLVDPATGLSSSVHSESGPFDDTATTWGTPTFMKKSVLEASFLRDDRIVIECDVTVIMGTPVSESRAVCEIPVPPSDVLDNLGKLLESGEGADVSFEVEGEVFHAHRIVLAMRSQVFKVELYGPMSDKRMKAITVEDMQPAVFKSLLHVIYNDSLPAMDDLGEDDYVEMVKHLLVAADRYAMERMKVMCESILGERLNIERVAATLALADQYHCSNLKEACIGFMNNSTDRMYDVMASEGYKHLKRACPTIFRDIWEKAAKSRKM
ncbi:BTB/POZ and MATH domain-containing protein 2 [Dichanthelium oligosanthes]|uniref:BTB/POZ and MATH domain-containing protein 2 n=1 Tax=Dichanthelium oligosanthes TaxID=888268 RepID=A0A1E5VLT2_9POAL|nr:BTB/POZ and MATH domain-containing protein 2 [Dichanthelium oligosanthes]